MLTAINYASGTGKQNQKKSVAEPASTSKTNQSAVNHISNAYLSVIRIAPQRILINITFVITIKRGKKIKVDYRKQRYKTEPEPQKNNEQKQRIMIYDRIKKRWRLMTEKDKFITKNMR